MIKLLANLLRAGADVGIDAKGIYCKPNGPMPPELKYAWREHKVELQTLLTDGQRIGLRYIWSSTLDELIVIATTSEAVSAAPPGVVCYSPSEINHLRGIIPDGLRRVHTAKKLFGGSIVDGPRKEVI